MLRTAIDRTNGRFAILLEDFADRAASFPECRDEPDDRASETLLSNLAALHAHYWRSDRFDDDLAWVPTPIRGGMFDVFDTIGFELISDQLERHPFKAEMIAPLDRSFDSMWDQLWAYQTEMAAAPTTLLHGDTRRTSSGATSPNSGATGSPTSPTKRTPGNSAGKPPCGAWSSVG